MLYESHYFRFLKLQEVTHFEFSILLNCHFGQVRDLNITDQEEDIGYYAGYIGMFFIISFSCGLCSLYGVLFSLMARNFYAFFIGSSFMFGRTLTSFFWGIIADKYGRKPVIVFSICSVLVLIDHCSKNFTG